MPSTVVDVRTRNDLAGRKNATKHAMGLAMLSRIADKWNAPLPYGKEEYVFIEGKNPFARKLTQQITNNQKNLVFLSRTWSLFSTSTVCSVSALSFEPPFVCSISGFLTCSVIVKCSFLQKGAYFSKEKDIPQTSIITDKVKKKSRTGKFGGMETCSK